MRKETVRTLLFLAVGFAVAGGNSSAQVSAPLARDAAAPGSAQGPASSARAASSAVPPISSTVAEVSLDLTVQNKHRKTVGDLQASQLAITDNGAPVQISSLRLVNGASGSQRLVTLLFDPLDRKAASTARGLAEKIIEVVPEQDYSLAVLQINGRLRVLQPYTRDRALVETAVEQATPALRPAATGDLTEAEKSLIASIHSDALSTGASDASEANLLLSALVQAQRIVEERHVYPSLAALEALVVADPVLTSRRFIFYFSSGMTLNSDARDTLRSIIGLANRNGIIVCVVDTGSFNGRMNSAMQTAEASLVLGNGGAGGSVSSFGGGGGFSPGAVVAAVATHYTSEFEFGDAVSGESPLVPLALSTGGIYFSNSGNPKHHLQQLHQELTSWYQASWTPPAKNYDGQFHRIVIHSQRKDLVIRARSGYFAVPPADTAAILPFEVPLLNALAGSALPGDIAYHAAVLHLGALPDGNSGELVVQIPVSELAIHEDANTQISSVHAAIVAVIKDSKGAVLKRFGEDFPLHETPEMFRANPGQAITMQRHFSADPGTYTLETAVMDDVANKAGVQRRTFTIEPPPQGPSLSDIALVEKIQPMDADDQDFDPMRYLDGRVVPKLAGDLSPGTRSLSLFFLLHPAAASESQPALRIQVFRDEKLLTEMPMQLKKVSGSGAAVPYLEEITGAAFAAGEYEVKALLTQDGDTVSRTATFEVPETAAAGSRSSEETDSSAASELTTANSGFVITSPAKPVAAPSDAEIQAMIEGTREHALSWFNTLPNFFCAEVTNHSVDGGDGEWKHKDTLVELMRYVDHAETRSTLLLDGDRSSVDPDELKFAHSAGEYGAMFHIIFNPSAKAAFTWKEPALLDGQPVQVFAFHVARGSSAFDLSDREGHTLAVGFHGLLYLDPATRSVRRISVIADDIPAKLLIRASSISVDYSWISMQNHDFLLPVRGAVMLHETKRRPVLNEFEFRDYRRFGSQVRILANGAVPAGSVPAQRHVSAPGAAGGPPVSSPHR